MKNLRKTEDKLPGKSGSSVVNTVSSADTASVNECICLEDNKMTQALCPVHGEPTPPVQKEEIRKQIVEIFIRWGLPTRQIVINELIALMINKKHRHNYSKLMGIDDYCVGCHEYRATIEKSELKSSPVQKDTWEQDLKEEAEKLFLRIYDLKEAPTFDHRWLEFKRFKEAGAEEIVAFIRKERKALKEELREKVKEKQSVRTAMPVGDFEDGFDYGYDTKTKEVLKLLSENK